MIIKDGTITYYRDQPHTLYFIKSSENSYGKPKGQVQAKICEFKAVEPNIFVKKKHPFLFEISFLSPLNTKPKRIFWVFAASSKEQLAKWMTALEECKKQGLANNEVETEARRKLEAEIAKEVRERALREEAIKKAAELDRRKNKQKEKLVEEERKKKQIEQEIKRLQIEAEIKRKHEEALRRKERYQKLLENSWDYNFQKCWSRSLENDKDFNEKVEVDTTLFKNVGIFLSRAIIAAKNIINEIGVPDYERQIFPEQIGEIAVYLHFNMLIKLAMKTKGNNQWKILGHEFRSSNMMFNTLYSAGKSESKVKACRVPLMCLIDYKGFRALVMALAPIEVERTLMHGSKSDGIFIMNQSLYPALSIISKALNLREHIFEWNSRIGPVYVHLSVFTELHKSLGYQDLEDFVKETLGKDVPEDKSLENHLYFMKLADLLPVDYSLTEDSTDFTKRMRPEFFISYPIPLSPDCFINIHPSSKAHDVDLVKASNYLKSDQISKLVNELDSMNVNPYDSKTLTQTFHHFGVNMRYLGKVAKISILPHIKKMVYVESLARAAKNLLYQHLSELIVEYQNAEDAVEAETEKKSYNRTFSIGEYNSTLSSQNKTQNYGERYFKPRASINLRFRSGTRISSLQISQLAPGSVSYDPNAEVSDIYMEKSLGECIVDYFNIVFGNDIESNLFWDEILVPYAVSSYSVPPEALAKGITNLNALLFSLIYLSGIFISFTSETPIGKITNPFKSSDLQHISIKVKKYDMKCVECKILSEKIQHYKNTENYSLALQALELKIKLAKALNPDSKEMEDLSLLVESGEIYLELGEIETAIFKAKEVLVQMHPLSAQSVRVWILLMKALYKKGLNDDGLQAFASALEAIKFHWGENDPMQINLYEVLGSVYMEQENYSEALLLYKNALLICLKQLGPNHILTGKNYMELSRYYLITKSLDDALDVTEKSYFIYKAFYGKNNILTVNVSVKLAEIQTDLGRYMTALPLIVKACEVYEKSLLNNPIDVNQFESRNLLTKYYSSASVGLRISLKTANHMQTIGFTDKLWLVLSHKISPDPEIVIKILKFTFEAKINSISPREKSLILNFVYVKYSIDDELVKMHLNKLKEKNFVLQVQRNGGISEYVAKVIEKVKIFAELGKKVKEEDKRKVDLAVSEIKAILEAVTKDENI